MSSIQNTVYYCCVSKGNRILYAYSGGDHEIENMAALCLERTPPFHTWYFQTFGKRTFGFLMEDDGYVYFTIVDKGLVNPGVLHFLQHVRDEFKKITKNTKNASNSKGTLSTLNSVCLQEQLVPVIRRLISSLEHVSQSDADWRITEIPSSHRPSPSPPDDSNGEIEVASSAKASLLGKPVKQDKKKMKDRVLEIRDCASEDHRRSTDRGIKIDVATAESNNQGSMVSAISVQKGSSSMRIRGSPQYARKMWWRKVRVILAIDAVVCLVLFGIWLGICHGFHCISN